MDETINVYYRAGKGHILQNVDLINRTFKKKSGAYLPVDFLVQEKVEIPVRFEEFINKLVLFKIAFIKVYDVEE